MSKIINVGRVTAYADAVKGGYQGTREEWESDLANLGTTAAEVEADRQEVAANTAAVATDKGIVEGYKDAANLSAQASAASAGAAHTDALAATAAKEASETAQGLAESAKDSAVAAKGGAETAQGAAEAAVTQASGYADNASGSATAAAGSATAAAGSATDAAASATAAAGSADEAEAVLDSIPEDYSTLSNDVTDLKSAIYESQNLDYSQASVYNTILSSATGKWYTDNNYESYFSPVPHGAKRISITTNASSGTVVAMLKTAEHTSGTYPDYATGGSRIGMSADTTQTFDIPDDCQYVYLLKTSGSSDYTPASAVYLIDTLSIVESDVKDNMRVIGEYAVEYGERLHWIQGAFNRTTGAFVSSAYAIQYSGFLPSPVRIRCDSGYKFLLHAWKVSDSTFVGHMYPDGTYGKSADMYGFQTDYYPDYTLGYKYKIALYHTDNTIAITPDEYSHCHIYLTETAYDHQYMTTAAKPTFVGQPETIFENDDEYAQSGIDAGLLNFVNVIKISDSMYYMYYECCAEDVEWSGYDILRLCFAYSTDGLNFTKGFPAGVEAPISGTNQLLPTGSTTGHCVVKVPDADYPYRMVTTKGTDQYRIAQLWRSVDAVHWTLIRTITNGYNDSQAGVVVRGTTLKIFLRTRNSYGRCIGIITTDLNGNRLISRWTNVITTANLEKQLYTSAAAPLDDHREILFPTIYNPNDSTEFIGCFIIDGDKCEYKELDMTAIMPNDVKSIYIGPGIVDVGLKTYLYYETRDSDHEHAVIGTTKSAIRRIEITDETFVDRVTP